MRVSESIYPTKFPFLGYNRLIHSSPALITLHIGILELTHNKGTENDSNFKYANGNSEPGKGFGHIAISVDDIQAACARFEQLGVPFQKRLTDGTMKHIAFIKDPDE